MPRYLEMAFAKQLFGKFSTNKIRLTYFSSVYTDIQGLIKCPKNDTNQTIKGWVAAVRKLKEVVFVNVNDGSTPINLQVVLPKEMYTSNITYGSSLEVSGKIGITQKGQIELQANDVKVVGECDVTSKNFPFSPKQAHSHEYCRQFLHQRPTMPHFKALLKVRHRATIAISQVLDDLGFTHIHTPILTSSDCEGGGEVFKVTPLSQKLIKEMKKSNQHDDEAFFGNISYLSVSGQLHLEAISRGITKAYAFSPTFRAENSKSRLHLTEFYMIETEESFVDNLNELLNSMEIFLKSITSIVVTREPENLAVINKYDDIDPNAHLKQLENIIEKPFVRMTFQDACEIIEENKASFKSSTRCEVDGLSKEQELFIVDLIGNVPVFITDWPKNLKPFYMRMKEDCPEHVSAVDLLVPNVGELCGGSLRENDFERLQAKLRSHGIEKEMQWYLDLRRFGNVPTAGFGMGFERFLQLVTNLGNIKDTIPFPRWPHSLKM